MADPLLDLYTESLPAELRSQLAEHIDALRDGRYKKLLDHPVAQLALGWRDNSLLKNIQCGEHDSWSDWVSRRIALLAETNADAEDGTLTPDSAPFRRHFLFLAALACERAFLQAAVTGPPLHFRPGDVLWPDYLRYSRSVVDERAVLNERLGVDGITAYRLTPAVELFVLADAIIACQLISNEVAITPWARLRLDFLHQRLLAETAPGLQTRIYEGLERVEGILRKSGESGKTAMPFFLVERASVHTHHGLDRRARTDLDAAATLRRFSFALTGKLGKRTRWQERDTSQLVVLARSADETQKETPMEKQPTSLDLNDDTLLESIAFTGTGTSSTDVKDAEHIPTALRDLEPGAQPRLHALDSVILLQLASSIGNTSPADGLTREETLPYATRVLEGGSANWQVYTQALLLRSRIDGYKARTSERGLLQLQALVDQVVADTAPETPTGLTPAPGAGPFTFLPRANEADAAPVAERLAYVHALASPTRRALEAELAQRWAVAGGLRSALDIFERLEMWAEAALCLAATDQEKRARALVRSQLHFPSAGKGAAAADTDTETWEGPLRDPAPADAPRLYCILGDMDADADMYEAAWKASGGRYARAQRSLGRLKWQARDFAGAAAAYEAALAAGSLHGPSWFALGCCRLEGGLFGTAAEAFARAVQIDDADAEAWSNLAVALLKRGPPEALDVQVKPVSTSADDEDEEAFNQPAKPDPQAHKRDALRALKRAAQLKPDSAQIWDNVLTVAASLAPPAFIDVTSAQSRLIALAVSRGGASVGESAIDARVLDALVRHVVQAYPSALDLARSNGHTDKDDADKESATARHAASMRPGSLPAVVAALVTKQVVPLITRSAALWQSAAAMYLWQDRPSAALDAHEKAWRAATGAGGVNGDWEHGAAVTTNGESESPEAAWNAVVDATVSLADAYASLGPRPRTEGLAAGSGELVAKDWRFKARSAVRGIIGRGKACWEETEGMQRLKDALEDLKS